MEESVLQEEHGAVGEEGVPLHLPEAHPAAAPPPLDGLPRHLVHRAHRAHLELVAHHVAQPLVVDDAEEDVGLMERKSNWLLSSTIRKSGAQFNCNYEFQNHSQNHSQNCN